MRDSIDYIYEELSKKHGIPVKCIQQLEKDWWLGVRKELASNSGRRILIPNFGNIHVNLKTLKGMNYYSNLDKEKLEDDWKNGRIPWMRYLHKYVRITRRQRVSQTLLDNIRKRVNRKKGERGL